METNSKFKGLIVFWVQSNPDQDMRQSLSSAKELNELLEEQMLPEGNVFIFAPTFDESTHVERLDCEGEEKGLLVFFLKFNSQHEVASDIADLIRDFNKDKFEFIEQDGRYKVLFVPAENEGSRAQKVEWDRLF